MGPPGGTAGYHAPYGEPDQMTCRKPSAERFEILFAKHDTKREGKLDKKQMQSLLKELCSD